MMIKKVIITVLLFVTSLVSMLIQANSPVYSGYGMHAPQMRHSYRPIYQQQPASPVDILEHSINKILKLLAQQHLVNIAQLKNHLKNEMAPNFDFDYMSRWVAGKRYHKMNKEQQAFFKNKFTNVFLSTFINKLTKNTKLLPRASHFQSTRYSQNEARANVLFSYDNGQQVKVDFRFFQTTRGWKVVDVKANGISALMYFRNYFSQLIKQRQSKN